MSNKRTPPRPQGAQTNAEDWARFFELFGHAKIRRGVRLMSKLPSAPRCEACGNPFAGVGGWLMRRVDKEPVAPEIAVGQGGLRGGGAGRHDPGHRGALRRYPQLNRPRTQGRGSPKGPRLEVGIGLDVGPA